MVSFENFIPTEGGPIYKQIIYYVKQGLAAGVILDGDEVPSRRALSALLGVNPNTVQKAFRLLEEEGLMSSTPGAKSLITADTDRVSAVRDELLRDYAYQIINAMKQMGVSREDALDAVSGLWNETENKE